MGLQSLSVSVLFNVLIFTFSINFILQHFILLNTKYQDQILFNDNYKHIYNVHGSLGKCLTESKMDKDEQLLKSALEKQVIHQHCSGCSDDLRNETILDKKSTHLYLPYPAYFYLNQMALTVYPVHYANRQALYRLATHRPLLNVTLPDSVCFSTLSSHGFCYTGHDRTVTCSGCNSSVELSDFNSKPSNARYHRNSSCVFIEQENNDTSSSNALEQLLFCEQPEPDNSHRYSQASNEGDIPTYAQAPGVYEVTPASVSSEENRRNTFKKEVRVRNADSEERHRETHSSEQAAASSNIHLASESQPQVTTLNAFAEPWGSLGATSSNDCLTLREYDVADSSQNEDNINRRDTVNTNHERSALQCLNQVDQRRNLRANRVVNARNEITTNLEYQIDCLAERTNYRRYNYSLASDRERSFTDLGISRARQLAPEWAAKGLFYAANKERTVRCYYCNWSRCWDNCNSEVMQRMTDHSCHCDVPALSTTKNHKDFIKRKKK